MIIVEEIFERLEKRLTFLQKIAVIATSESNKIWNDAKQDGLRWLINNLFNDDKWD